MKKLFVIFATMLLLTACGFNKNTEEETLLTKSNDFNDIKIEKVTSLEIVKYTVGGREESSVDDYDEILKTYNYLNSLKVGNETNKVCEDNTTIYNFKQGDKVISIEIECDLLVIDNKRYELIK